MVVAAMSPEPSWKQPLLRTVDTLAFDRGVTFDLQYISAETRRV
jgi:hypothetical protein